jgi:hypothetical protein
LGVALLEQPDPLLKIRNGVHFSRACCGPCQFQALSYGHMYLPV